MDGVLCVGDDCKRRSIPEDTPLCPERHGEPVEGGSNSNSLCSNVNSCLAERRQSCEVAEPFGHRTIFQNRRVLFRVAQVSNYMTQVMTMWDVEPYTLDLSDVVKLSDDDLLKICAANPDLRIERNAAGQLEIMSPSGFSSSAYEAEFVNQLGTWNDQHGEGVVITASGGFHLPNGAVRAADAAWIRRSDWDALTTEQQDKYAPVVPIFVVEVRSPSDRLRALQSKMVEWIENGCRLAWLIDPIDERACVYRANGAVEERQMDDVLSGEDVLPGFLFDLKTLR